MQLKVFKTLWGYRGSLEEALDECTADGFDGLEGPSPDTREERHALRRELDERGLDFIAEICTAGSYVPRREATIAEHLDSFERKIEGAIECGALFITSLAGCDAWSLENNVAFFQKAHQMAKQAGIVASFEIHRSRSLFNPWVTRDVLCRLPELRLTCDYSHWCVVCERLIDSEPDVLALCASRAHHIHARVGYEHGPQVPDPAAHEYSYALHAHERWWRQIWAEQRLSGREIVTMTAEFGPDGYMQTLPHTQMPVADLGAVNRWMAKRQKEQFNSWIHQV